MPFNKDHEKGGTSTDGMKSLIYFSNFNKSGKFTNLI